MRTAIHAGPCPTLIRHITGVFTVMLFCVGYSRNNHILSPSLCIISFSVTYSPKRLSTPTLFMRSTVISLTFHAVINIL